MALHSTRAGTQPWMAETIHDAANLSRASNLFAAEMHGELFSQVVASHSLVDLDLAHIFQKDFSIPAIRNGANRYVEKASQPRTLKIENLCLDTLPPPNLLVVIPEALHLAHMVGATSEPVSTAWDSLISGGLGGLEFTTMLLPQGLTITETLRFFDSHLSVASYWSICSQIVSRLGLNQISGSLPCVFRPYLGDLASRFDSRPAQALFVSNQHLAEDVSKSGNTGRRRIFDNPNAANKESLLLVGDSHSYSAMSQILSYYFRRVEYIWANRAHAFGSAATEIAAASIAADLVVEEISERFFLQNFTVTTV